MAKRVEKQRGEGGWLLSYILACAGQSKDLSQGFVRCRLSCKSGMVIVTTSPFAHASFQAQQPPLLPCLMSNTQHKLGGADLPSVPQRCT